MCSTIDSILPVLVHATGLAITLVRIQLILCVDHYCLELPSLKSLLAVAMHGRVVFIIVNIRWPGLHEHDTMPG